MPDPAGGPITDAEIREYEDAESGAITSGLKKLDPTELSNVTIGPGEPSVAGPGFEGPVSAPVDSGPSGGGGGGGGGGVVGQYNAGNDADTCGEEDQPVDQSGT